MTEYDKAYNAGTATSVTTGSAVALVAANPNREYLLIQNDTATNVLYLSLGGTAVANVGIRVNSSGGSILLQGYTGAVSAIALTGTVVALVAEW